MKPGARIIIVGAGIGGLAAGVRLLAAGYRVTIVERAARPGGKIRQIPIGNHLFDGGPSVLTMPWVLDELCAAAGAKTADLFRLSPLAPLCRHFFCDGSELDLYADEPVPKGADIEAAYDRAAEEFRRVIGPKAATQYRQFRRHAAAIYDAVERPFLRSALPAHPIGFLWTHRLRDVVGLLRLDARRSLFASLCSQFDDERLRMLFARYATYGGANPFIAPATLSVIAHVELAFGVHAVEGGFYRVAEGVSELFTRLGGELRTAAEVERVELDDSEARAVAVHVAGERLLADGFVINCDVAQLHARLLAGTRIGERLRARFVALPPSYSAYLNLCVAERAAGLPLVHHNVFFSSDYLREFEELAERPPSEPTIYLCNPDFSLATQRWFFLTNAPAVPESSKSLASGWRWTTEQRAFCRGQVAARLHRHGIPFTSLVSAEAEVTPPDFATLFPYSRGALYGAAANSRMAAFSRPPNRVEGVPNLFCVGGSTHPGAGVPMAMLSAAIVCKLITC
jgi:1-hydroxycarotenoid 3,4-desaturase